MFNYVKIEGVAVVDVRREKHERKLREQANEDEGVATGIRPDDGPRKARRAGFLPLAKYVKHS